MVCGINDNCFVARAGVEQQLVPVGMVAQMPHEVHRSFSTRQLCWWKYRNTVLFHFFGRHVIHM